MTQKVIDGLRKLDPKNDAHWTQDGLPKVDFVRILSGEPSLTREQINEALPGFSRTNTDPKPEGNAEQSTGGVQQQATDSQGQQPAPGAAGGTPDANVASQQLQAPPAGVALEKPVPPAPGEPNPGDVSGKGTPEGDGEGEQTGSGASAEGGEGEQSLETNSLSEEGDGDFDTEYNDAKAELDEALADLELARQRVTDAQDVVGKLDARKVKTERPGNAIQEYLQAQRKQREEKAELRRTLSEAGVTAKTLKAAKDVLSPSKLDQALSGRRQAPKRGR